MHLGPLSQVLRNGRTKLHIYQKIPSALPSKSLTVESPVIYSSFHLLPPSVLPPSMIASLPVPTPLPYGCRPPHPHPPYFSTFVGLPPPHTLQRARPPPCTAHCVAGHHLAWPTVWQASTLHGPRRMGQGCDTEAGMWAVLARWRRTGGGGRARRGGAERV